MSPPMHRRSLLALAAAALALSAVPGAAAPLDRIVADLRALGYDRIEVQRTLLGRTRILAESEGAQREIIVNPRTGEILRDLWLPRGQGGSGTRILSDGDGDGDGKGRGRGRGGDDERDDRRDDDRDDDRDGGDDSGGDDGDDD